MKFTKRGLTIDWGQENGLVKLSLTAQVVLVEIQVNQQIFFPFSLFFLNNIVASLKSRQAAKIKLLMPLISLVSVPLTYTTILYLI